MSRRLCPEGHPLTEVSVDSLSLRFNAYCLSVKCDRCKRNIEESERVLHCDECDYDLCSACRARDTEEDGTCPAGHELVAVPLAELGGRESAYRTGAICNSCGRRVAAIDGVTIYHCSECSYDMCFGCWNKGVKGARQTCSGGHTLRELSMQQLIREMPAYLSGAICNICGVPIVPVEGVVLRHCNGCTYDVCRACWNVGTPRRRDSCRKGHALRELSIKQLGEENSAYAEGAICNICGGRIQSVPDVLLRHCDECNYDVCRSCWGKARPSFRCAGGHPLREVSMGQLKDESESYATGAACNGCGRVIRPIPQISIHHCGSCFYDICNRCWEGGLPRPRETCSEGHVLREVSLELLSRENPDYSGGAICNICGSEIRIITGAVVRHCHECSYDVCSCCWCRDRSGRTETCPEGHELRELPIQELAGEEEDYHSGAICNLCGCLIHPLPGVMMRHCGECEYDLCRSCWNKHH